MYSFLCLVCTVFFICSHLFFPDFFLFRSIFLLPFFSCLPGVSFVPAPERVPMSLGKVGPCLLGASQPSTGAKGWHSHSPLIPQQPQLDRGSSTLQSQQPDSDKFPLHSWEMISFFGLIICLKYIFQWCQETHFGCKQPPFLPNLPALLQNMGVQSFNWMTILLLLTWKGAWVFLPHTVFRYGWTFQNV